MSTAGTVCLFLAVFFAAVCYWADANNIAVIAPYFDALTAWIYRTVPMLRRLPGIRPELVTCGVLFLVFDLSFTLISLLLPGPNNAEKIKRRLVKQAKRRKKQPAFIAE